MHFYDQLAAVRQGPGGQGGGVARVAGQAEAGPAVRGKCADRGQGVGGVTGPWVEDDAGFQLRDSF